MKAIALLIALAIAGCQTTIPPMPKAPEIVKVPVDRYVVVPAELTKDCVDEPAKEQTYAEAKRLALKRTGYLDECTGRMRKIRGLKGSKPDP